MKQENQSLWERRIKEQKASGITEQAWCKQNQLTKHTYYYWHKRICVASNPPIEKQTLFVEVKPETESKKTVKKLQIQWRDLQLEISDSAEAALAAELISHLQKLC